jgi:transposase-like protein
MDFPIIDLMDNEACYRKLLHMLHPEGLHCPRCGQADDLGVHRRNRAPVLDYQCESCGCVFNAFTGTALQGTHRPPSELMIILRGISQGVTTAQLARELKRNRPSLLQFRHNLQANALAGLDKTVLADPVVEVDELYQNAGEKRQTASRCG